MNRTERPRLQPAPPAVVGAITWTAWAAVVQPAWTAVLLLMSPFVLVPLGLAIAAQSTNGMANPALRPMATAAPAVALCAAASFGPAPGLAAAALTVPWLLFTLAVATVGLGRVLSRSSLNNPSASVDAGLVFLCVGGAWLTLSRAGLNPLGFSDAIVQLTAVHFHYAGFALPIVAGVAAHHGHHTALVPAAVTVGVPLTAVGITAGGSLEWVAATFMALAGLATASLLFRLACTQRAAVRLLLGTAAVALAGGMALAFGWAWSIHFGWRFLGLESMAATHGSLNALGFGLLGLTGLTLLVSQSQATPGLAAAVHLGRPTAAHLEHLASIAATEATTNPPGILHQPPPPGFERKQWRREVERGDFARAVSAIDQWAGHRAAGISYWPERPIIEVGQTLALAIPVGPVSITATCRIVEVVDEADRYGFAYSTLPHHAVDGEESFMVQRGADGSVEVAVTAVWRSANVAHRVFPLVTRFLQHRAITAYLGGIVDAAENHASIRV